MKSIVTFEGFVLKELEDKDQDVVAATAYIIRRLCEYDDYSVVNINYISHILCFCQATVLAIRDKPLFKEPMEAWRCGPISPSSYHFYSVFESKQLPVPEVDIDEAVKELIDVMMHSFSIYDGSFTHTRNLSSLIGKNKAWAEVRKFCHPSQGLTKVIPIPLLKKLGLNLIEYEVVEAKDIIMNIELD